MRNATKRRMFPLKYRKRYESYTVTHILKTAKVFLSIFSAVLLILNCLRFGFLMKRLKDLLTNYKLPKQRKTRNQTVPSVQSVTTRTRESFGVLQKWMLTM